MTCQLTTSCLKPATLKVTVNDGRTAFVEKQVPACEACAAKEPKVLAENQAWKEQQLG